MNSWWARTLAAFISSVFIQVFTVSCILSIVLSSRLNISPSLGIPVSYLPGLITFLLILGSGTERVRSTPVEETRCRVCGYILRGIPEPRCPECGERI